MAYQVLDSGLTVVNIPPANVFAGAIVKIPIKLLAIVPILAKFTVSP